MPIAAFRRLGLLLPALCLLALSASAEETGFIAEIDDLPLMPGLAEVEGAGVVFDKPSGRIVEAYARGAVTREAVASFYRDTLPQLGWSETAGLILRARGRKPGDRFLARGVVARRVFAGPIIADRSIVRWGTAYPALHPEAGVALRPNHCSNHRPGKRNGCRPSSIPSV